MKHDSGGLGRAGADQHGRVRWSLVVLATECSEGMAKGIAGLDNHLPCRFATHCTRGNGTSMLSDVALVYVGGCLWL